MKVIKKLLVSVLTLAMLAALLPAVAMAEPAANAGPHISCQADVESVTAGNDFTVTLKTSAMTISTFTGGITYDSSKVELKSISTDTASLSAGEQTLDLTIAGNETESKVGISSVGTQERTYQANDSVVTLTFTAKASGDAVFTLYEDVDGTDTYKSDSISGTTVTIADEEYITYVQADGTETKIYTTTIKGCDATENGNYLLKDVLSAAEITTTADCNYSFIGGADNYTVQFDAEYYEDMALFYSGGWRANLETNAPGFAGKWYQVSGLHTIKEVNHAYGEDSHTCENLITKGRNKDKTMQEEACGAAEEYITYVQADGTETKIYTTTIKGCDATENGNYLLKDVLSAAGITTTADCNYTFIGGADNYTVQFDAEYYEDMALFYSGGWRANLETNAPGFAGKWYQVSGLHTIKEVNHAYGEDSHTCENLITKGRNKDKSMQEEACGAVDPNPAPVEVEKDVWIQDGGKWWYKHADGSYTKNGWEYINGKWYLFDTSGWMLTGWQKVNGTWYYLNTSGAMATGWIKVGNTWYYMNTSGAMATGWVKDGNTWYYMNTSGAMATGWVKVGNTWYYMNTSGAMATGWVKDGNTWYYMSTSGAMATGWVKDGNTWYYMSTSGAMTTGWVKVGNTWYYMSGSGAMLTGWQKINGSYYYLYSNGAMAANTWIGNYYVNASGVWTQTR